MRIRFRGGDRVPLAAFGSGEDPTLGHERTGADLEAAAAGGFRWPAVTDGMMKLSAVEFAALFDGLDWTRVQTTKGIPKPSVAA